MQLRMLKAPSCRIGSNSRSASVKRAPLQLKQQRQPLRASTDNGVPASDVDFDELSDIIRLVNETDIVELSLKSKRFNLEVRKQEALKVPEPVYQMMQAPQQGYAPQQFAPQQQTAPAAQASAPAPAAAPSMAAPAAAAAGPTDGIEIGSPMSGTFYSSAAPGEPSFVKLGDKVKKGQTVGIIEAMKLMNEIEAEVGGEVVKIMVENGKSVSPGQPLMIIRP